MNIKILKPIIHASALLAEGALAKVEDKIAKDLVERGLAEPAPKEEAPKTDPAKK